MNHKTLSFGTILAICIFLPTVSAQLLEWEYSMFGVSYAPTIYSSTYDLVADLENDGKLEVIPELWSFNKTLVLDYDGTLRWTQEFDSDAAYDSHYGPAFDLDDDGDLEIVTHVAEPGGWDYNRLYVFSDQGSTVGSYTMPDTETFTMSYKIDIDEDGELEIILYSYGTTLYVLESDGSLKWSKFLMSDIAMNPPYPMNMAADLDSDGDKEILVTAYDDTYPATQSYLFILDHNGNLLGSRTFNSSYIYVYTSSSEEEYGSIKDLDNDGDSEIIVDTESGLYVLDNNANLLWSKSASSWTSTMVKDIDADSDIEVIVHINDTYYIYTPSGILQASSKTFADSSIYIYFYNLDGGNYLESFWTGSGTWDNPSPELYVGNYDMDDLWSYTCNYGINSYAVHNLDGSGDYEVIVYTGAYGTDYGAVYVLDSDGNLLGSTTIPLEGSSLSWGDINDTDDDGTYEIMLTVGANFYVLNHHGELEWNMTLGDTIASYLDWDRLMDFNGDGVYDIVLCAERYFYVLSTSGTTLCSHSFGEYTYCYDSQIGDFNNDGYNEFAVNSYDDVYILDHSCGLEWQNTYSGLDSMHIYDLDGDSVMGVMASTYNSSTSEAVIYFNEISGSGVTTTSTTSTSSTTTTTLTPSLTHANVSVDPATKTASKESTFTIDVVSTPMFDVQGYSFRLAYDSTILDATSIVAGDFLSACASTVPQYTDDLGLAGVDNVCLGETVTSGTVFATITFEALEEGDTDLTLQDVTISIGDDVDPSNDAIIATTDGEVTVTAACPGDADADSDVDYYDLLAVAVSYGSSTGDASYNSGADFDSDGDVDYTDLLNLAVNYGSTC